MKNSVKILVETLGWHKGTAEAHVRSSGKCEYCENDLLNSRLEYSCMQIDHLLPKSKYRDDEWNFENWLTSCSMCNSMKGLYDPLLEGESPTAMLSSNKEILIKRVRDYLQSGLDHRESEYKVVKAIIRS